jgi:arginyl-tRNA synthetase
VHIGHVRNTLISESLARILEFAGNAVVKCSYPGDIGAHVAKWIWYYLNFYAEKGDFPQENFTKWVGELYTQATKKVDENPEEYKAQIGELQKKLEDGDSELQKLWMETRELCLKDMKAIFAELGSEHIDKWYFESEVEQPGIQIIQQLLADGIAQYSEGAVAMNLEEWKLGWFLLLKSTGASLYSTKDIALAYRKKEEYPNYDISLYVVGCEQEYHFQQLFKTLELIGFDHTKLHHLAHGLVDLKDEKMSSRA